jgi:uncharacterized membrane protein
MKENKENVGTAVQGRILSIDILRGIAVIGMVLVHFALMFFIIGFIGGPAPANCGMGCTAYLKYVYPILVCFVAPLL